VVAPVVSGLILAASIAKNHYFRKMVFFKNKMALKPFSRKTTFLKIVACRTGSNLYEPFFFFFNKTSFSSG